jgi:putative membrane protein
MNRKTTTLLSLGISVALIAAGIWFLYNSHNRFGYGNGRWAMPYHMMAGGGGGMGIVMVLFWLCVLSAVALMISGVISNHQSSTSAGSNALEILRQRYARGEIDKIQFEEMQRDLK